MCLNIKVKEGHEGWLGTKVEDIISDYIMVAEKNFGVYKALRKEGDKYFAYERGTEYVPKGIYESKFTYELEHEHISVYQGIHAFTRVPERIAKDNYVLALFTVPEGAQFMLDSHDDEIVADNMVFERVISEDEQIKILYGVQPVS